MLLITDQPWIITYGFKYDDDDDPVDLVDDDPADIEDDDPADLVDDDPADLVDDNPADLVDDDPPDLEDDDPADRVDEDPAVCAGCGLLDRGEAAEDDALARLELILYLTQFNGTVSRDCWLDRSLSCFVFIFNFFWDFL